MTTATVPQVNDTHYKEVVQLLIRNSLMSRAALYKTLLDPEGRNLNYDCGYPDSISISEYKAMWDREGDARRVVRCEPEACWVADPFVYETEDPEETEFEKAWAILLKKFNLYNHLFHLDEISGIGQYGILLFGLDDGEDLSQPVPGVSDIGEGDGSEHNLIYLREFDESCVQVSTRESKTTSPRYSLPLSYKINFMDTADSGVQATDIVSKSVHWTRVLHVADNQLVSQVYGTPRMKPVYNRLMDIRKILGGSAEMFWKGAFPGISFEMNPDLADQGIQIDTAQIREEVKAYMDGLQRFLAIQGMQAKQLAPTVADPSGHVDTHRKAIAIALSVPFRVLFGSEQAQLASGQDAKTWNARVGGRQNKYVTPTIIRPFVDRMIALGCLPAPQSGEYIVNWPDLDTPSESDKAGVAVQKTSAITTYIAGGGDQLLPPATFLTQVMGMEQDQVDAIMKEVFDQQEETEEGAVMPAFGAEGTSPEEAAMPSAFNGAQVTAATQIVKDVAAGELPRESGLGQLEVFFRLTPEQASQVMGTAGTKTKVEPNPGIKDDEVQPPTKKGGQKPPFPVGNYDPDQPREPAGTPEGGQFASEGGSSSNEESIKKIRGIEAVFGVDLLPKEPVTSLRPSDGYIEGLRAEMRKETAKGFRARDVAYALGFERRTSDPAIFAMAEQIEKASSREAMLQVVQAQMDWGTNYAGDVLEWKAAGALGGSGSQSKATNELMKGKATEPLTEEMKAAFRKRQELHQDFVREKFKDKIDADGNITLYRGIRGAQVGKVQKQIIQSGGDEVDLSVHQLSSFSVHSYEAHDFATNYGKGKGKGALLMVKVPVKDVWLAPKDYSPGQVIRFSEDNGEIVVLSTEKTRKAVVERVY